MASDSNGRAEAPLRIPPDASSAIFVKAAPETDLVDLAETIEQIHPNVQAVLSSSVAKLARGRMSAVASMLLCVVAALWATALLLNGIVFSQVVRERQSEIGLLIAKGAERSFVFGLLAKESGCIALASSLLGCAVGLMAVASSHQLLTKALGVSDALPTVTVTVALVAVFVGFGAASGIIAALLPVHRLLKTEPYEAIKQGAIV
jgi:ABC-type antimicrobial peptide transport system permease subunit